MELAIAGVLMAILLFCVSKILPRISAYGEKLDEKEQKRLEEVRVVREEERKRRLEESREQADLFYSDRILMATKMRKDGGALMVISL
jgi:uncharacterized membrane protein YhiD involved in acid resistance